MYVMALDQGTTSSRTIVFDKHGNIVAKAQNEFRQIYPQAGWVEHDPMEILGSQLQSMSMVLGSGKFDPQQIKAIGITNQRETTIIWDKETGLPIYNAIVWQSCQSEQICQRLKTKENERIMKEKTGLIIDPYFSATKIKWIYENVKEAKNNKNRVDLTTLKIVNKEISNNKFDSWFENNFNTFCIPNDITCKTFIDKIDQLSLIKSYVQDSLDMIELKEFLNSSYVELLKKAKEWLNSRKPNLSNLEKNKEKVKKLAIACLVKKTQRKEELKRQKLEELYMLDKMKSYDSYKRKQQAV